MSVQSGRRDNTSAVSETVRGPIRLSAAALVLSVASDTLAIPCNTASSCQYLISRRRMSSYSPSRELGRSAAPTSDAISQP